MHELPPQGPTQIEAEAAQAAQQAEAGEQIAQTENLAAQAAAENGGVMSEKDAARAHKLATVENWGGWMQRTDGERYAANKDNPNVNVDALKRKWAEEDAASQTNEVAAVTEAPKGFTVEDKRSNLKDTRVEMSFNGPKIRDYEPKHDVLAVATPTVLESNTTATSGSRHAAPEDQATHQSPEDTSEATIGKHFKLDENLTAGGHSEDNEQLAPTLSIAEMKARQDAEITNGTQIGAHAADKPQAETASTEERNLRNGRIKRVGKRIAGLFSRNKNNDIAEISPANEVVADTTESSEPLAATDPDAAAARTAKLEAFFDAQKSDAPTREQRKMAKRAAKIASKEGDDVAEPVTEAEPVVAVDASVDSLLMPAEPGEKISRHERKVAERADKKALKAETIVISEEDKAAMNAEDAAYAAELKATAERQAAAEADENLPKAA